MNRRQFFRKAAAALPMAAVVPTFSRLAAQERKRVKITDVKCMRVRTSQHTMPLVKIETDAGTFKIPPPDLWADDVMLLSSVDPIGAARALIGDTYDDFVAAGGSAAVLMSIVNDVHGASTGE